MSQQIFINLAVKDLQKALDFYSALGFSNNPQFSDDAGKCMVWSEHIYLMLLTHEKFASFATKPIADTQSAVAGLYSLSTDSIESVNTMMENGLKQGGKEPHEPRNYGFMYQRTIEDADGHTWELFFMDMSQFPKANE